MAVRTLVSALTGLAVAAVAALIGLELAAVHPDGRWLARLLGAEPEAG